MISGPDALERLREGNRRFVSGERSFDTILQRSRRHDLVAGQRPIAVVLGCSDSRVPVEARTSTIIGHITSGQPSPTRLSVPSKSKTANFGAGPG